MQDLQQTKALLYKLACLLREPTSPDVLAATSVDDEMNPLLTSFYNQVRHLF